MSTAEKSDDQNDSSSLSMMLPSVLGSAAASIVSRACTHPLDTAKARLQASSLYKGPMDTLFKTFRTEGIQGLYRGFGAVLLGGTPGTMLYLCSYEVLKKKLSVIYGGSSKDDNFAIHFSSGMLAETLACVVYVPVDVVKERMQVQCRDQVLYNNSVDAFVKIMKTEGLAGIYKGYAATLASFGPFSALYFMFYEQFKHLTRQYLAQDNNDASIQSVKEMEIPFPYVILTSCSAGALASWLTSPLDMAKLRLQIQRGKLANNITGSAGSAETYRGVVDCLQFAYKHGGVHGLFRGAWARVLHFAPATTITMTCYETFRSYFAKSLNNNNES